MRTLKTLLILAIMVVTGSFSFGQNQLKLSLAEWSLHRALNAKEMTNMDFPRIAKTKYNLDAVEYEGTRLSEDEGIKATKLLLDRLIAQK